MYASQDQDRARQVHPSKVHCKANNGMVQQEHDAALFAASDAECGVQSNSAKVPESKSCVRHMGATVWHGSVPDSQP